MKTLDFMDKVNKLGFSTLPTINQFKDNSEMHESIVIMDKYLNRIAQVSTKIILSYNTFLIGFENLCIKEKFNIICLINEYVETPYEDRLEEVKYHIYTQSYDNDYYVVLGMIFSPYNTLIKNKIKSYQVKKESLDPFLKNTPDTRFKKEEIMDLPNNWIPKIFGGYDFVNCIEVDKESE